MKHEAFAWLQIQEARRGSGLEHGPGRVAASALTAAGKPRGPVRPGAEPGTPGVRERGALRGDRSCSSFSWSHFGDETGGPGWVAILPPSAPCSRATSLPAASHLLSMSLSFLICEIQSRKPPPRGARGREGGWSVRTNAQRGASCMPENITPRHRRAHELTSRSAGLEEGRPWLTGRGRGTGCGWAKKEAGDSVSTWGPSVRPRAGCLTTS